MTRPSREQLDAIRELIANEPPDGPEPGPMYGSIYIKPLIAEIDALAAEVATLREALLEYGSHGVRCSARLPVRNSITGKVDGGCDCRFAAALAATEKEER